MVWEMSLWVFVHLLPGAAALTRLGLCGTLLLLAVVSLWAAAAASEENFHSVMETLLPPPLGITGVSSWVKISSSQQALHCRSLSGRSAGCLLLGKRFFFFLGLEKEIPGSLFYSPEESPGAWPVVLCGIHPSAHTPRRPCCSLQARRAPPALTPVAPVRWWPEPVPPPHSVQSLLSPGDGCSQSFSPDTLQAPRGNWFVGRTALCAGGDVQPLFSAAAAREGGVETSRSLVSPLVFVAAETPSLWAWTHSDTGLAVALLVL